MSAPVIVALTDDFLEAAARRLRDYDDGLPHGIGEATANLREALESAALSTGQVAPVEDELPL